MANRFSSVVSSLVIEICRDLRAGPGRGSVSMRDLQASLQVVSALAFSHSNFITACFLWMFATLEANSTFLNVVPRVLLMIFQQHNVCSI